MQQIPPTQPLPGPSSVSAADSADPSEDVRRSSRLPLRERLAIAWQGGGELWGVYWWLIRDVVREFPLLALAAIALSFAAAILLWVSAFVVLIYVNARVSAEGGGDGFSLPILGTLDLSIGDSVGTLFTWGSIALVLVLLASLTGYGANAMGIRTARRYVRRAGGRILTAVDANPGVLAAARHGQDEASSVRVLRSLLVRETAKMLRGLFILMRSADAAVRLVVATGLIILINPLLTLVLVGLGLIFAIPLYGVNRRVARTSLEQETTARNASQYSAWLAKLVLHTDSTAVSPARLAGLYAESKTVDQRLASLSGIILAAYRSQYIVTVFAGVAAVTIVFAFALSGTADVGGWTSALIYVAALLAATSSLTAISVAVTVASRYLPQVRRYTRLMQASSEMAPPDGESASASTIRSPGEIRVGQGRLPGSLPSVRLNPGEPVFVHYPDPLDRTHVEEFLARLFGLRRAAELRRHVFLCGDSGPPPATAGADELSEGRNSAETGPAVAGLDDLVDSAEFSEESHVKYLDGRDQDEDASAEWRYAATAWLGLQEGASIVIFGWRSFSQLDGVFRARFLASLAAVRVLLVSDRMPGQQPDEAVATVLVDEQGVRGIADSELHREWARLAPATTGQREHIGDESLEDELDEI